MESAIVLRDHPREQQVVAALGDLVGEPGKQAHEEWIGQVLLGRVAQRQNHADGAGPAEPEVPCGLVDLESVFPRQRLDASPR